MKTGIDQAEYVKRVSERVQSSELKIGLDYILRMMMPSQHRPPYAVEIFGKITRVTEESGQPWSHSIEILADRPQSALELPIDSDNFVITPNVGPRRDRTLPEGFVQMGYLLGATSLNDVELKLLTTQSVTSN